MSLFAAALAALLLAQAAPLPGDTQSPDVTEPRVDEELNDLRESVEQLRTELDEVANEVEENADAQVDDAEQLDSDLRAIEDARQQSEGDRLARLDAIEDALDAIQVVDQALARGETAPADDVRDLETRLVDAQQVAEARSSDLEAEQLDAAVEGIRLTLASIDDGDHYRARLGLLAATENLVRARDSVANASSGEATSELR